MNIFFFLLNHVKMFELYCFYTWWTLFGWPFFFLLKWFPLKMLHINLNGALNIKNDFFLFILLGVLLNCSIYYYYYFINFFRLLAFNFSYIKYVSPLPHPLKCAPPSPGPIFSFFHFGYTLQHRIFTAILTCSTIETLPSGSQKKKKKLL